MTEGVPSIEIEVVLAVPAVQQVIALTVPANCTAREAVALACAKGLDLSLAPDLDVQGGPLGIFGRHVDEHSPLQAGDRVELYRPLVQDPRERRRRLAAEAQTQANAQAKTQAKANATPSLSRRKRKRRPRSGDTEGATEGGTEG